MNTSRKLGKKRFLKMLPRDRVDPVAVIGATVDIICNCFRREQPLRPRQEEFETVRQALVFLLRRAACLNDFLFWGDLEFPQGPPAVNVPGVFEQAARRKNIAKIREVLADGFLTQQDLVNGMDVAEISFTAMLVQFANGRLSDGFEDVPEEKRYLCSAVLHFTVNRMKSQWRPLRKQIERKLERSPSR